MDGAFSFLLSFVANEQKCETTENGNSEADRNNGFCIHARTSFRVTLDKKKRRASELNSGGRRMYKKLFDFTLKAGCVCFIVGNDKSLFVEVIAYE